MKIPASLRWQSTLRRYMREASVGKAELFSLPFWMPCRATNSRSPADQSSEASTAGHAGNKAKCHYLGLDTLSSPHKQSLRKPVSAVTHLINSQSQRTNANREAGAVGSRPAAPQIAAAGQISTAATPKGSKGAPRNQSPVKDPSRQTAFRPGSAAQRQQRAGQDALLRQLQLLKELQAR